jgi:hypothetical protein
MIKRVTQRLKDIYSAAPRNLILILIVDVIIIALAINRSIIHWLDLPYNGFFVNDLFTITEDGKLGEIYQYIKEIGIVIAVSLLVFGKKELRSFIGWGILFIYILIDDALGIHELLGEQFEKFPDLLPSIGLSNKDLGELVAYAVFGIIFSAVLIYGYFNTLKERSTDFQVLVILFVVLLFFGVFVDIFISSLFDNYVVGKAVHIIEEAGEMIAVSMILWFVIGLYNSKSNMPQLIS